MRVWQLPPEPLLTGGLPLLALAPISAATEGDLPNIMERMERRLGKRPARKQAPVVWGAAFVLLGLRYSQAVAEQLFRGVRSMKESSTYQAILEEGRQEGRKQGQQEGRQLGLNEGKIAEARRVLRLQGDAAFGPPDASTAALIDQLDDLARLEEFLQRVRTAENWQELLGPRGTGRRGKRKR